MILKSQAQISRELNCTRANVGQSLRRSINKMYRNILNKKLANRPFEAFEYLTEFLNLHTAEDINEFFSTMPREIQEEIRSDVAEKARYM